MTRSADGEDYILSLADLLTMVKQRLGIVLLVATVIAGAAVGLSLVQTPTYEASIKLLVGQERGITQDPNYALGLQELTQTIAEGVGSRRVAEAVIRQGGLAMSPEDFLEKLNVEQVPNTQFIEVSYTDTDPQRAQRVANTVGDVFSKQVSKVSQEANAITAMVWDRAAVPEQPASPNPLRNGLLGLVMGLMLGVGLAFLLEYLDDSWRSPEEVEQVSGVPTYGVIPTSSSPKIMAQLGREPGYSPRARGEKTTPGSSDLLSAEDFASRLVTIVDPTSVASEAYRTLRTNLIYSLMDTPPKVIVLTSPGPGEGKSTICANLGVVLSQAGKEVLIVDCDFRKPVMHKFFGIRNLQGVVDVLAGERRLQEVWGEPVGSLKVVPVGTVPPNPTEILGTQHFANFLAGVRKEFDYVLVDAPPVGLVSDPAILATQGDGVLLVLDARSTRKGSVRQAVRSMETVGATMLGAVMNNVDASKSGYYHYGYYGNKP